MSFHGFQCIEMFKYIGFTVLRCIFTQIISSIEQTHCNARFINPTFVKIQTMKTSKGNGSLQSKQQRISHKPKPEIRDDMDSRKNREGGYRGTISKKGDRKKKA